MGATVNAIKTGWKCCDTCNGFYTTANGDACVGGSKSHSWTLGGSGGITEGSVPGWQDNWRQCKKCGILFYYGNPTNGSCFKGGAHDLGTSPNYSLKKRAAAGGPSNNQWMGHFYELWRWCHKCESLFFGGNTNGVLGSCPKGGSHDASKSEYYSIVCI